MKKKRGNAEKLKSILTIETAEELLSYEDGNLYWKVRPEKYFRLSNHCRSWNTRFAGKLAQRILKSEDDNKYYVSTIFDCNIFTHHLVWFLHYGKFPSSIDHIDGNSLNNRIENLRDCSISLNNRNSKKQKNNTSGVTGVHWCKLTKRWVAKGYSNGKTIIISRTISFEDAKRNRLEWLNKQDGYTKRHGL